MFGGCVPGSGSGVKASHGSQRGPARSGMGRSGMGKVLLAAASAGKLHEGISQVRGGAVRPGFLCKKLLFICESGSRVSHPWAYTGFETPLQKHLDLF